MKTKHSPSAPNGVLKCGALTMIALQVLAGLPQSASAQSAPAAKTPIKHVIVIIGENRTFDHVYGTYTPKSNQSISNLLSKGIVNRDGTPGPNYALSAQFSALDDTSVGVSKYENSPQYKSIYSTLPPALAGGPKTRSVDSAPFTTLAVAELADQGEAPSYDQYLITGQTGITSGKLDTRITNANNLREGVFQITGPKMPYDAYTASPVHRFFQMWQQTDCNVDYATEDNASGCLNDLFPWVETSVGTGSNGAAQPSGFTDTTTGEGSTSMGFYNMAKGDAPYFKQLADQYTISDNFHQSVMGGTGANHIMFGFGDAIFYTNGTNGTAKVPPTTQVENPNPQPNTNNYYDQDGYSGGSYVNCGDLGQPGVPAVTNYLESLKRPVKANCVKGDYYLVNNYNPGYNGDGTLASQYSPYTIPPTNQKSIGDDLSAHNIPFKYFGEDWDLYVTDPTESNSFDEYCNICNPFQYQSQVMGSQATREAHIADTTELYEDIDTGNLPPVSVVKPSGFNDGHPASSKLDLFEGFVKKVVDGVKANPTLWNDTAIFITFDEGGGYYDSGYIQPVDFFGDGTRIPLIIVSKYTAGGRVSHEYGDHVSLLKFIEKNWGLPTVSTRSRDNLPNPKQSFNTYVPTNSPAIGDLMDNFYF